MFWKVVIVIIFFSSFNKMSKERFKVDNVIEVKNEYYTNYHTINNLFWIIKYAINKKFVWFKV
jgi:hypothetical protein